MEPKLIICDEAVSALDVSIQAQVINLLLDLQQQLGVSYVFISHDLAVVKLIADRVGVMYLGKLVEVGTSEELYANPAHPYTQALLSAAPIPDPKLAAERQRVVLEGEVPSPDQVYTGCCFAERCPIAESQCHQKTQQLVGFSDSTSHQVACWKVSEADPVGR